MDIFTEQAATYDECIAKITGKHGPNIHVLRQKKIRTGGFLGFFEHDAIELNFMLSRDSGRPGPGPNQRPPDFDEERKKILNQAARTSPELANRVAPHIASLDSRISASGPAGRPSSPAQGASSKEASAAANENLETILDAVKKLEARMEKNSAAQDSRNEDHPTITRIEALLEKNDFSPSFIKNICARIKKDFSLENLDNYDLVQDTVLEWIGESILISENSGTVRPRVIVLVGPTGVGKTTTVAKLAAAYSLAATKGSRPLSVRVITIDNYRIGAKQQIEIYGNIMNIPVSCAETPNDLKTLMAMYAQDVDIVLIDTIGKSPRDYTRIAEMRQFLDAAGPISDVHLAMSATTKTSDMREIMQQYETFGYRSVIITKFDETVRVGNIISVLGEKQKPLAYITNGQRVPQDFEQASVVRFLTNLEGFRVNRSRIEELFPLDETKFEWR